MTIKPYDLATLVGIITVMAVQNKFDVAKNYVAQAHKLFPEDVEIKYYAQLIRNKDANEFLQIMKCIGDYVLSNC